MDPWNRVCDIESRVKNGTVSPGQALAELTSGPKPWTTAWWKDKRLEKIEPQCGTCGKSDPPLVLQHTWHPTKFGELLVKAGPPHWEWWKEMHPIPQPDAAEQPPLMNTPVCPQCGSHSLYLAKKRNRWVCTPGAYGPPHRRHADAEFAEPKIELRSDRKAARRVRQARTQYYQERCNARWQAWKQSPEGVENHRLAVLLSIEESKRYLSLDDTKTLCRRCAAREDSRYIRRSRLRAELGRVQAVASEFDADLTVQPQRL